MVSLILSGGYIEERWEPVPDLFRGLVPDKIRQRWVKPGHINVLTGQTFHRVDLLQKDWGGRGELACWTLFLVGPKFASWGFRDRMTGKFTHWKKYIATTANGQAQHARPATRAEMNDLDDMGFEGGIYNGRGDR
jgi:hypothetical protein